MALKKGYGKIRNSARRIMEETLHRKKTFMLLLSFFLFYRTICSRGTFSELFHPTEHLTYESIVVYITKNGNVILRGGRTK